MLLKIYVWRKFTELQIEENDSVRWFVHIKQWQELGCSNKELSLRLYEVYQLYNIKLDGKMIMNDECIKDSDHQ